MSHLLDFQNIASIEGTCTLDTNSGVWTYTKKSNEIDLSSDITSTDTANQKSYKCRNVTNANYLFRSKDQYSNDY